MKTHFFKLIFSLTLLFVFESQTLANNTFTCSADSVKAVDDIVSTRKNTGVTFRPVQNDYLVGVFLGVSIIEPPRHGSIAFTTVDALLYQPEGGFCGKDTLRYRVCTTTKCDSAYVYIGVSCEAGFLSFPIAHNDFVSAPKNAIFTFNPLENDQLGGTILGTGIVREPKYGAATFRPNELIYIPRAESCGKDTMTYRVCNDKYQCDTASIFFNIACDILPAPVPVIVTYRMRLDAPSPTGEVYLTGDFLKDGKHGTNWSDPSVLPLKKGTGDNFYVFTDTVFNKQYQFKFLKGKNWADSTGAILVETARFDKLGCGTANNSGVANRILDLTVFKTAFSQVTVTYDWNKCTPGLAVPMVVSTAPSPALGGRTFGGGSYYQGDSVLVKAISSEGYRFLRWEDNAISVSQDSVYRFVMGNANRALTAIFSKATSVENVLDAQFSVYPNPTTGVFYVKSNGLLEVKEWTILDGLGRKILRGSSFKDGEINLNAFNKGVYFLQVITDKGDIVKRIVLER